MRCNLCATLSFIVAGMVPAAALNPIHEASYNLLPRGKFASSGVVSIAGILDSRSDDLFQIPFSLSLEASPRVELGGGIKTQWGDASDDHVPYLVFGAKYMLDGATTLQGDLLLGANISAGKGFSIGVHHRQGHAQRLYSRFTGRLGFMEALVQEDALLAMEGAWYPTFVIVRPLSLEFGLIASSQTTRFNDYFALDFQPALQVHIGRESLVETAVAIGLAGEQREDLRVKVAVVYGF